MKRQFLASITNFTSRAKIIDVAVVLAFLLLLLRLRNGLD